MITEKMVRNFRYGLATNSSSTHSIIHNADSNAKIVDEDCDDGFGWNFFTCASKECKKKYMIGQLIANIYEIEEPLKFLAKELGIEEQVTPFIDARVDHQSGIELPKYYYNKNVNMKFFEEYYDYIVNNNFVILGGNDNDDVGHPLDIMDSDKPDYQYDFHKNDIAFKNGNYWIVRDNIRKMRITFHDDKLEPVNPELIDLKITDYCDMGCPFCYQGSSTKGIHADLNDIKRAFNRYTGSPYEFAIGGGEPTQHPEFAKILKGLSGRGNVLNFTTRSDKWFKDKEIVDAVNKYVSGIAYSVDTIEDAEKFIEYHKKYIDNRVAMYVHIIPELIGADKLIELINYIDTRNKEFGWDYKIKITLLGYKSTGRGSSNNPNKIDNLIKIIKRVSGTKIGIDTKIANDYKDELRNSNIPKKLYTNKEGEFSMYADMVNCMAYKSSYELDEPIDMIECRTSYGNRFKPIKDVFEKIREKGE